MSIRKDLGSEANTARRLFWEMCASRQPQILMVDHETLFNHYQCEDSDDIARWADHMLYEWDKRWIEEEKTEGVTIALEDSIDSVMELQE